MTVMVARHIAFVSLAVLALTAAGCSSSDSTASPGGTTGQTVSGLSGDIRADTTWQDGQELGGIIRIVEGVTVTIAPGAHIKCNAPVQIQIGGTLKVDSAATHASIACSAWTGLLVASQGSIDANGLDISNAEVGVEVTGGAGNVSFKNSQITTSTRPFTVRANATLTLDHVKASVPTTLGPADSSVAEIYGTLNASFIEYDSQTNEGIMLKDGGNATITDSTLVAANGLDLVSSYSGGTLTVSYTTMVGAHCGLHMQGVKQLNVDHVTSTANIYGITIYGADNAAIKDSNFGGSVAWLDLQGDHGPVTFNDVYHTGNGIVQNTEPMTESAAATATVSAATPRAN